MTPAAVPDDGLTTAAVLVPLFRDAEQEHIVRAPVRAKIVVPVQFIPQLIGALQEHMRVFSESYSNVGWSKGPVH